MSRIHNCEMLSRWLQIEFVDRMTLTKVQLKPDDNKLGIDRFNSDRSHSKILKVKIVIYSFVSQSEMEVSEVSDSVSFFSSC